MDKLPVNLRLDWACHKRNIGEVDLETFGNFMSVIVAAAANVTLVTECYVAKFASKGRDKEKQEMLNVHAIDAGGLDEGCDTSERGEQMGNPRVQYKVRLMECFWCDMPNHRIVDCEEFGKLSVEDRWKRIQQFI